jgi:hypothetical protein
VDETYSKVVVLDRTASTSPTVLDARPEEVCNVDIDQVSLAYILEVLVYETDQLTCASVFWEMRLRSS